jgi:predicted MFS family arabinose efflux permease
MVALAAGTLLLWGLSGMQSMLAVFRGDLQDYFGLSIRQFGFLLSVTAIPGSLGALVSGYFTDRFGARPVLRICLIGVACGMGLVATGGSTVIQVQNSNNVRM